MAWFVVFSIYLVFLLLAEDHSSGLGRPPPLPENIDRWRCRPLILNRAAHYNGQLCLIWDLFFSGESLHTNNHHPVYSKDLCRLPLVWQGTPRSLKCSSLLIHPTCLERQRQQAVNSWEPPVTIGSLQVVLPEIRFHLNNQPPK